MSARPTISDAALEERLKAFRYARTSAVLASLHAFTLTDKQILRVGAWLNANVPPISRVKGRVNQALALVDDLCTDGKSANAALKIAAAEFGYPNWQSLRKARSRRAARLRT